MVTFAGGYAMKLEDTITIHCNTVIAAKEVFGGRANGVVASTTEVRKLYFTSWTSFLLSLRTVSFTTF